jgi:hypothetical protein
MSLQNNVRLAIINANIVNNHLKIVYPVNLILIGDFFLKKNIIILYFKWYKILSKLNEEKIKIIFNIN